MSDLQQQASDPDYSVWVSASAGTGKTKILTDRFLRLLIKGVNPKNILCLTFTNAAAVEMQLRISNKLKLFSCYEPKKLEEELFLMSGCKPLVLELENAKTLYGKLLDSNAPLNIYTIHAFCQKILKTFPLEAGITPEFQILEETKLQDIFLKIRNEIYLSDEYNSLVKILLNRFHEITLQDIFSEIIEQKIKFKKLFTHKTIPEEINNKRLALKELNNVYDKVKNLFTEYDLAIEPKELFFTKDGKKRKSLLSKDLTRKYPKLLLELEKTTPQIYKLDEEYRTQETEYHTNLLTKLAYILLKKYDLYKEENNLLDYDDLIFYTERLLNDTTKHEWLLHKLESEFNHILVDEAQDTSREQWNIIACLVTEFNAADKPDNSIFVVGDDKQSIYSFQGADLHNFNLVNEKLKTNLANTNKKFKNITLEYSYRSCSEILQFTHHVFKHIKANYPNLFLSDNPLISAFRTHNGSVAVWRLIIAEKQEELFWALPTDYENTISSADLLIEKIVGFIKEKIAGTEILPSTGKPISEKDFMILVRKRDEFSKNLIKELSRIQLKIEESDRVNLKENLTVMDLISVAKFVLLPDDDLNLAALLKSPVIGMSEQQLYELLINKNNNSLWENIKSYKDIYNKLNSLIELYKISTAENFFDLVINNLNLREILKAYNGNNDIVNSVGLGYKERGTKPMDNRRATSDIVSEFKSIDYNDDIVNELLTLSKNYANDIDNSLQGFVSWFENNDIWIKRDMEHAGKIRVMTIHGSKGLEAPIVILCDSTSLPISSNKFIWSDDGEMFFSANTLETPKFLQELKEAEKLKDLQEYIRLLYVAMTRAKDQLIIGGFSNKATIPENCWYEITKKLFN